MRCSHCGHEVKDEDPRVVISDGPVDIEVVLTRARKLCPYCFEVIKGKKDPDESWLPVVVLPGKDKR